MKVLVIEPHASGHRMVLYAKLSIEAMLQRGWDVGLLTTRSAVDHPAASFIKDPAFQKLKLYFMEEPEKDLRPETKLSLLYKQMRYRQLFRMGYLSLSKSWKPDAAYVPYFDYLDKSVALLGSPFGSLPTLAVMMDVKFHRSELGIGPTSRIDILYSWFFRMAVWRLRRGIVGVIDEAFYEFYLRKRRRHGSVRFIPDVGVLGLEVDKTSSRQNLQIEGRAFVVLVYGSLSERKGIANIVEAVHELRSKLNVTVLLAGELKSPIEEMLDITKFNELVELGRIKHFWGFQTSEQENLLFRSADAVWLGYTGGFYGSSGVLYQAIAAGCSLLATETGLIGWLTRKYNLGVTFEPTSISQVATAVEYLVSNDLNDTRTEILISKHSPRNHQRKICEALHSVSGVK